MRVIAARSDFVGWRRTPVCQSMTSVPQPLLVLKVSPPARSRSRSPSREPSAKVRGALARARVTRSGAKRTTPDAWSTVAPCSSRMASALGEANLTPVRSSTLRTAST